MTKYKCYHCDELFDESEIEKVEDDPSPVGVSLSAGCYIYYVCPICGDDVTEVDICHRCGEKEARGSGYCQECECEISDQFKIFVEANMGDENSVEAKDRLIEFLC